jgi:hypothetical protein
MDVYYNCILYKNIKITFCVYESIGNCTKITLGAIFGQFASKRTAGYFRAF